MSSPHHALSPDRVIIAKRTTRWRTPIERWAALVALVALAPDDTPTLEDWAALARLRLTLIVSRCRAAAARPKDSLDLGRLVRAVLNGDPRHWSPESVIDIADSRTVKRLLERGGLDRFHHGMRPPLSALFRAHQFVVPSAGVALLSRILEPSDRTVRPTPVHRNGQRATPKVAGERAPG